MRDKLNNMNVIFVYAIDALAKIVTFIVVLIAIAFTMVAMFMGISGKLISTMEEPAVSTVEVVDKDVVYLHNRFHSVDRPTLYVNIDDRKVSITVSDTLYECIEIGDTLDVFIWDTGFSKHVELVN